MKTIAEALAAMMPRFAPLSEERLPLLLAHGRFLAREVRARFDSPPFSNSAMDGYAVRSRDVAGATEAAPVVLPLRGESRAGTSTPAPLEPGTAMRILTGAPMPEGADAVVAQEDTRTLGDRLELRFAAPVGHHVRRAGEDLREGACALPAGACLGPGELGLLASQGLASVGVHRRPRVAVLSTGDELRDVSDPPLPGTIVDSNAYAIAAHVLEAGGEPLMLPRAPDDLEVLVARLREALRADLVLTTGGVSVGTYDFLHEAFAEVGVEASFWKVAMKPGKPITFGTAGPVPVVGLPGNPVSAAVTFQLFVRPGIRRLLGDPAPHPRALPVALGAAHRRKGGRDELVRARLERVGEGLVAHLHRRQGSGALPSVAEVDALVLLPAARDAFAQGERLLAIPFGPPRGEHRSPFEPSAPA